MIIREPTVESLILRFVPTVSWAVVYPVRTSCSLQFATMASAFGPPSHGTSELALSPNVASILADEVRHPGLLGAIPDQTCWPRATRSRTVQYEERGGAEDADNGDEWERTPHTDGFGDDAKDE